MSENIKELTKLLKEVSVEITELNSQSKELGKVKSDYEQRLIASMDAIGTTTIKNDLGNFRKAVKSLPKAEDWEAIYDWVKENDAFYLLQRRLSSVAYQELIDAGQTVPGTSVYERETISITKP